MNLRMIYQSRIFMYLSGLRTFNTLRKASLRAVHAIAFLSVLVCDSHHRATWSRWRKRLMFFLFILLFFLNPSSEIVNNAAFPLYEVALFDVGACVCDES